MVKFSFFLVFYCIYVIFKCVLPCIFFSHFYGYKKKVWQTCFIKYKLIISNYFLMPHFKEIKVFYANIDKYHFYFSIFIWHTLQRLKLRRKSPTLRFPERSLSDGRNMDLFQQQKIWPHNNDT